MPMSSKRVSKISWPTAESLVERGVSSESRVGKEKIIKERDFKILKTHRAIF